MEIFDKANPDRMTENVRKISAKPLDPEEQRSFLLSCDQDGLVTRTLSTDAALLQELMGTNDWQVNDLYAVLGDRQSRGKRRKGRDMQLQLGMAMHWRGRGDRPRQSHHR
ncbi:hypothetical protein [Ensifer adhaerens]|uniref:hypothetical protein n=1 Tax=Ensifer adhaerens TaxID=106592 RepID=UPI0011366D1B|nr:hypothetical protein [Ensifer adhaerens]MDF8357569.1 hypothetical protein [Ensifer adhaerens]THA61035.1 hypothetical protein E5176_27225 [Ensifer adhaerens]